MNDRVVNRISMDDEGNILPDLDCSRGIGQYMDGSFLEIEDINCKIKQDAIKSFVDYNLELYANAIEAGIKLDPKWWDLLDDLIRKMDQY